MLFDADYHMSLYLYKKIIILYIIKNLDKFLDMKKRKVKRENRAFDLRMEYSRKAFGQRS